jgi:hypothetical protein
LKIENKGIRKKIRKISESGSHGRKKLEPDAVPLETNTYPEADLFHKRLCFARPGLHHPHPYNSLYFWHTMQRDRVFSLTLWAN